MLIARLFSLFRRRVLTSTLLAGTTAVVVFMAVTATGIPVNHELANDGGVWVTNDNPGNGFRGTVGEFNVPIKQLGYTFGAPGPTPQTSYDLDVLQQATTVLAIDRNLGALYPVDSQSGSTDAASGVTFPVGSQVALGGGVAAILQPATGAGKARLWVANMGSGAKPSITGLNTTSVKPALELDGGEALAVDDSGNVYVASPKQMVTIPFAGGAFAAPITTKYPSPLGSVALTTVGSAPVILDSAQRVVHFPLSGTAVTLPAPVGSEPDLVLQQSGPPDSSVLVASSTTLVSVPLAGQMPAVLATAPSGKPANPVRLDGCAYAAWAASIGQAAEVCESGARVQGSLPDPSGQPGVLAQPVFRVNHNQIELNDTADGAVWTVAGRPAQVLTNQDWVGVLTGSKDQGTNTGTASNPDQQKKQPKLDNPTLFARSGKDSVLHVLDNDTDPGGSILSIIDVTPSSGPGFSVQVAPDTQTLVLSLLPGVTAPVTFQYQVVDGFGLTNSGPVTVVPTDGEKPPSPPSQDAPVRPVASGSTVHIQVLGDWRDPESDPLSLAKVSVPPGMGQAAWTSDGLITYSAPTVVSDTPLALTVDVTDGRSSPAETQLGFTVLGRGDVTAYPPTGVPDAVRILVDRPTVVTPLENDTFGADPNNRGATLALAGPVASTTGLTVETNVRTGQLTLTGSRSGAYSLSYHASYGSAMSAPTQILVQVVSPAGTVQPPVTSPQSVLLQGQYPASVDALATDYDPAGGLLTVVGATAPNGLQVTVVKGQFLRISAQASDPPRNQIVTYQVTNGRTDPVPGQVTVLWQPAPDAQPPVVPDVFATVRAGDEVDVPVLATATDPDGETVHLLPGGSPQAVVISQASPGTPYPTGLGSASISYGYVRYSAPSGQGVKTAESVVASYIVESQDGQRTTGSVFLTVVPNDPVNTTPPQPTEVDARVTAGGTVTIPIPTTGVDPDGDSVTLAGIGSAPQLGEVLSHTANSITYQAFPFAPSSGAFSGGTDDFSYVVVGPSGLEGTAQVRVGVSPPAQSQPPVAADHFVVAAPGDQVAVDLLSGDFISPGDQVTVQDLKKTNSSVPASATLGGAGNSILQATAPHQGEDPVNVAYGLSDGTAAVSVGHVLIRSQSDFVTPPVAIDDYPAAPADGSKSLTVDVLKGDSDPGGRSGDLTIVGSPVPGVQPSGDNLIIPVGPDPRAVPYIIKSSTTGATAVGVVHVLGTDMGPQMKSGSLIHVPENGSTTINISDFITESGHSIRLTTTDQTSASPSGGLSENVTGNTAIALTGLSGYIGPGSLTVQVIDAPTLSSPGARTGTFSIPVVVGTPTPVVRCPSAPLTVVQGGPAIDVSIAGVCQVWTPDGSSPGSVVFTQSWKQPAPGVTLGWQSGQDGHALRLVADSSAKGGATGAITIGVIGGAATASSVLDVQVVEAPPPSATPANAAPVNTGKVVTVDMAQYVSSPLAQPHISVVSVQQTTGSPAPATSSGSVVTISPHTGTHGILTYAVAVSDQGPGRPDRTVNDTLTVQVLDVPGAPTGIQGVPGNHQLALSWGAAPNNGAPVDHYIVSMGGSTQQASGTSYTWSGLTNGQTYSFTVVGVNQVGSGAPANGGPFSPRSAPDAPTGVNATSVGSPQGSVAVSWTAANPEGEPITGYTVFVSPNPGGPASIDVAAGQTSLPWSGLDDAVGPYSFTVIAHNSVGASPTSGPSNPAYAHGVPATPAAPTAVGQVSPDQASTSVVVSWPAIGNCNDAQPCASYVVTELKNGSVVTTNTPTGTGGGTVSANFGPITNDGASYTYTLAAVNREGQTSVASGASAPPVPAVGAPAQVTDFSAAPGNTKITLTFTLPASHASTISEVKYTATGGSSPVAGAWNSPGASGQQVSEVISGLVNGTTYSVRVSACNESGKCGPDSSAVSGQNADPYGPPNPPSVSASQSGMSIVYTWSGGGNNGRPVVNYTVCIDASCSSKGASPGTVTIAYRCSTTHDIYANVVDSVGQTSSNSATVNATTQTCLPPAAPSISASASGNSITWSWNGGGGSPLSETWFLCIDGGCHAVGASPGSENDGYGCGQTHSAYMYVQDQLGQNSPNSNTASATTAACPNVSISWGGKAPSSNCGGDTSCTYLNISWANFSSGNHLITPLFDGGAWGASSVTKSGSSGSYNGGYWAGWCQQSHTVTVVIDGVTSNAINTTQHSC